MGFTFVIDCQRMRTFGWMELRLDDRDLAEHMEDDDPTPRALPRWVELEYKHMCTLAGPDSFVAFTHLSTAAAAALTTALPPAPAAAEETPRTARAECHEQGVLALMQGRGIARERVCLLDPKAPEALAPSDGDAGAFAWFLFGVRLPFPLSLQLKCAAQGILGDDPPRDRTAELRALGFPTRHLGPVQMTTDTALGVTKRVVVERVPLDEIPYVVRSALRSSPPTVASLAFLTVYSFAQDYPTIRFNARESVEMPFRASSLFPLTTDMIFVVSGYMIAPGTKDEPLLPPGMKAHLHADLDQSFDF
ncbi:hypothetical protein EDB92DRAFT_1863676 [Lactarius akahatsu]|uniref:Uncharacterized protein n=1 Tax=Lactarius akahatsu TaxID=416441 RepID=A0AAD4QDC6_9AGAM|nr:hypothetical protein EDB92DRAFT_1863676 [Lactarius akahatsu]